MNKKKLLVIYILNIMAFVVILANIYLEFGWIFMAKIFLPMVIVYGTNLGVNLRVLSSYKREKHEGKDEGLSEL